MHMSILQIALSADILTLVLSTYIRRQNLQTEILVAEYYKILPTYEVSNNTRTISI